MVIIMLLPYIGKIRSITTDNGSEFAEHLLIAKRLRTKVFFAHPYSSREKDAYNITTNLYGNISPKKLTLTS